ncbi:phosphatase PAP2 family protein [Patescibacteria group bacterium]|nr:phosphatase PAP2 family protein [Patescibacteria group bacterium]MBU1034744.1 phosphatase PAP2 family protein [Patescibacteria group bacterium]MBU1629696.1 phosphatase PAP2 family protein [Patescibacteria group bacterium]MBU1907586.1 phosphatase PAP2 family protein [Patescibacteria group bacterium]
MGLEHQFVFELQKIVAGSALLTALAIFCARYLIIVFAVFIAFLLVRKSGKLRHAANEAAWSALTALLLTTLIAFFMERLRPFQVADQSYLVTSLIPPPLTTAFPSGHTSVSVAMACAILFANRPLGFLSLLAAALIALGRLAVGVHYPSDILGGIIVGVCAFFLVRFAHYQIRRKDIEKSARTHKHF